MTDFSERRRRQIRDESLSSLQKQVADAVEAARRRYPTGRGVTPTTPLEIEACERGRHMGQQWIDGIQMARERFPDFSIEVQERIAMDMGWIPRTRDIDDNDDWTIDQYAAHCGLSVDAVRRLFAGES